MFAAEIGGDYPHCTNLNEVQFTFNPDVPGPPPIAHSIVGRRLSTPNNDRVLALQARGLVRSAATGHRHVVITPAFVREVASLLSFWRPSLRSAVTAFVSPDPLQQSVAGSGWTHSAVDANPGWPWAVRRTFTLALVSVRRARSPGAAPFR
jgi:hypothetical protein